MPSIIYKQSSEGTYISIMLFLFMVMAAVVAYLMWFWALVGRLTGPRMWPLLGSIPSIVANRARIHDWLADNLRAVGRTFTYQTCLIPIPFYASRQGLITVTCNPRNLEHILRTRFENYPKGPLLHSAFHDLLGQGIFNADGKAWLLQRKTAALEFTTRSLRQAMARWTNASIKTRLWVILQHRQKSKQAVDLQDLLLRLTFDSICGLTFGKDPETLSPDLPNIPFASAFDTATEATLQRLLYPGFLWRLKKYLSLGTECRLKESLQIVDAYITQTINARINSPSDDLLSRFMSMPNDDNSNHHTFPPSTLRWIALNFVIAGRDTSSVALSWFFWEIMRRPDVEAKVVAEIAMVLEESRGSDNRNKWTEEPLTYPELDKLVYLKAALTETLRLYPSVPEDIKYVVEDDKFPDGTVVAAGSTVMYSIYSVGRMEEIWGEDCMEFKPERWIARSSAGDVIFEAPRDGYTFVAFNGGPRTCLGRELAYLQMKSVASAVLMRHRLELVPGHRVSQKMSLTLFMKNGLRVYLHPRSELSH